jgi:pimeloyl-ACP methyl ester carboxylesterase
LTSKEKHQLLMQHQLVTVDDAGDIPQGYDLPRTTGGRAQTGPSPHSMVEPGHPQREPTGLTPLARLKVETAKARGWGQVAAAFYFEFLDWLEFQLNSPEFDGQRDNAALIGLKHAQRDNPKGVQPGKPGEALKPEDFNRLLSVFNPVHAFGYNWLQSNDQSGAQLNELIDRLIAQYDGGGRSCKQVILITHSMGGMVARAACKLHGAEAKVAGVFHGVLPADGAAATYKRMLAGFDGEMHTLNPLKAIQDIVAVKVLGPTGEYTTPKLSANPGPLELLPNARYNQGKPWLHVKDSTGKVLVSLPKAGDPYADIYLNQDTWWKLVNAQWMNPAGVKETKTIAQFRLLMGDVQAFHEKLQAQGDFHANTHAHYGDDASGHKAYGEVTWTLDKAVTEAQHAQLQRQDFSDSDMHIDLHDPSSGAVVHARLSMPEASGDGTVPAAASAARVCAAVKAGNVLNTGFAFAHDQSFAIAGRSTGPAAALQAIVRILN